MKNALFATLVLLFGFSSGCAAPRPPVMKIIIETHTAPPDYQTEVLGRAEIIMGGSE